MDELDRALGARLRAASAPLSPAGDAFEALGARRERKRRTERLGGLALGIVLTLALIAGLVGLRLSAASAPAAGRTPPPHRGSAPAPVTLPPSPRPSSPSPAANSTPRCAIGQLLVAYAGSNGAAGSIQNTVSLTNVSHAACSLYGYPGMLLLDSSGHALHTTVVRGSSVVVPAIAPRLVVLQPGARAGFLFGYSDVPGGATACPAAAELEVTPPNDYSHRLIQVRIAPCHGVLTTSPVFPGIHPPSS